MTVHVNDNCIGCGLCVNMCGNVFLMTEEGVAAPGTRSSLSRRRLPRRLQRAALFRPLRSASKPAKNRKCRCVLGYSRGKTRAQGGQTQKEGHDSRRVLLFGASDEARTRYLHLGKVALYQMSYTRKI